jgi:hypothetical protein
VLRDRDSFDQEVLETPAKYLRPQLSWTEQTDF